MTDTSFRSAVGAPPAACPAAPACTRARSPVRGRPCSRPATAGPLRLAQLAPPRDRCTNQIRAACPAEPLPGRVRRPAARTPGGKRGAAITAETLFGGRGGAAHRTADGAHVRMLTEPLAMHARAACSGRFLGSTGFDRPLAGWFLGGTESTRFRLAEALARPFRGGPVPPRNQRDRTGAKPVPGRNRLPGSRPSGRPRCGTSATARGRRLSLRRDPRISRHRPGKRCAGHWPPLPRGGRGTCGRGLPGRPNGPPRWPPA